MNQSSAMREHAKRIIHKAIQDMLPDYAVTHALSEIQLSGDIYIAAFGKAGWQMAYAASKILDGRIKKGVVVTKYEHSKGALPGFQVIEAGHPVPDENSVKGAELIIDIMQQAKEGDTVILLVSGGGSALLEKPEKGLTLHDIQVVTNSLLRCGAPIQEMNIIRKRLSAVKGGKLAQVCKKAKIYQVVLSDIIDDNLEMIASGPACGDTSTYEDVCRIKTKYGLEFSERLEAALQTETPAVIENVESMITGSVRELCRSAAEHARELGYEPHILTTRLECEAREAGSFMASIARSVGGLGAQGFSRPCAIIAGGETVVNLTGHGKGGRNQELAFSAARGIEGMKNVLLFSLGSDGTDGPTDAAGGMVDGTTMSQLWEKGIDYEQTLRDNDSYHALKQIDGLIVTGATGTNVNDVSILLCR